EIIFDSFSTPVSSACGPRSLRRLQKLTIKGSDNSAFEEYGLEYHSVGVGGGTDHWGYLNNSSLQAMPNFSVFVENLFSGLANQAKAYLYGVVARTKLSTDLNPFEKLGLSAGSDT